MRVFGLKSCDTCRKALRDLRDAGHNPQVIDVRADGVDPIDLNRFLAIFGDELVNRRSTTWRGLSPSERDEPPIELLGRHPTLMRRPIIEMDGQLFLGWRAESRGAVLG